MTIKNILHNVKKEANAKHFLQRRVAQHIAINWNKRPRTDKMLSAHMYLSAAKFYSDTRLNKNRHLLMDAVFINSLDQNWTHDSKPVNNSHALLWEITSFQSLWYFRTLAFFLLVT